MARRVFFAFHYERDVWRAGQVRNSWVTKPDREDAGFWDAAEWESVKRQGDEAVKRWIKNQLSGTSVTAVLIGAETSERKWVKYEIIESYNKGNGILGIYIHNIKDQNGYTDTSGNNPFNYIYIERDGRKVYFSEIYPTYDWVNDNGYENLGVWVEEAAKKAGK
ncbi:MAG: TIR domain-containing protein [Pseudomonadota bacterium]